MTPFGDVVGIAQRGLFIGNRGIIHDVATKTLLGRRWTTKAWLRLQGAAPGGDGRPQLDRAFLSRRSGGARGRASPVLLLPPRGGRGISHRLGQGEGREGASSAGEISFIASICSRIFFGRVSSHIPGELKQARQGRRQIRAQSLLRHPVRFLLPGARRLRHNRRRGNLDQDLRDVGPQPQIGRDA